MSMYELNFDIKNNTSNTISMNILGGVVYSNDISNQLTSYTYDFTGFSFLSEDSVSILYRPIGTNNFAFFSAPIFAQTFQAVVSALNSSNLGSFYTYQSGGVNYIQSYSDRYEFATIDIYDGAPAISWTMYDYATQSGITETLEISYIKLLPPPPFTYTFTMQNGIDKVASEDMPAYVTSATTTMNTGIAEPTLTLSVYKIQKVNGAIATFVNSASVPPATPTSITFPVSQGYAYIIQGGTP